MLREGRNARSVKGVLGTPFLVKFVTSPRGFEEGPFTEKSFWLVNHCNSPG